MSEKSKINWKRTNRTHKELSENCGGEITFAQEKAGNRTRNVQIGYVSFSEEKQAKLLKAKKANS